MQLINTSNVYTFILTEVEWYLATDQQREAWQAQCLREASEFRCQYATILVQPDAIMSVSPVAKRHKVWGHTFPTTREEDFKAALDALRNANLDRHMMDEGLSAQRMAALAREVFGQ